MRQVALKLKQASAVLGVAPKDLQNLVQLKVLRPPRRDSFYWFDKKLLLEAKLAFYLKESLGTSSDLLACFTEALSRSFEEETKAQYVWLSARPAGGQDALRMRIPLRSLAKELEKELPRASVYADLPRGRKRKGWRLEVLQNLTAAAGDLRDATESEISDAVRQYRLNKKKRLPEISIDGPKKRA